MSLSQNEKQECGAKQLPVRAEAYIPHSGSMCVIGDLIESGDKNAAATAVVRPESLFARADGTAEEIVFVEMIAQTMAAGNGFCLTEEELRNQEGYLLGIKSLKIYKKANIGDPLIIKAVKTAQFGTFGIIEGKIYSGADLLAEGEIKVFQRFIKE